MSTAPVRPLGRGETSGASAKATPAALDNKPANMALRENVTDISKL
jgi:hypothetical protein